MQPPDEALQIELIYPNQRSVQADLLQGNYSDTQAEECCPLTLRFEGREISSCQETQWHSLCAIRAELEKNDIFLRCYGGSRNVYPSGMCLSMGDGAVAYRTQIGQPARAEDLVSIFHIGPDVDPATLEEQEDFHRRWMNGFRTVR